MKIHKAFRWPFTLIEALLALGIVAAVGGFAVRLVYGRRMIAWENEVVRSLGINPEIYRVILALGFFALLIAAAVRQRRKRNKSKEGRYELPR